MKAFWPPQLVYRISERVGRDLEQQGLLVRDMDNSYLTLANRVWALGYPVQARALSEEAVTHARRCGHHFNLCWTLGNASLPLSQCGDYESALQNIEELSRVAKEEELLFMDYYMASSARAQVAVRMGRYEETCEKGRQAEDTWQAAGGRFYNPIVKACIAEACTHLGRVEEAIGLMDAAVADIESTGEFMIAEEIYRVAGLAHAASGDAASAELLFERSLDIARQHETRSY